MELYRGPVALTGEFVSAYDVGLLSREVRCKGYSLTFEFRRGLGWCSGKI